MRAKIVIIVILFATAGCAGASEGVAAGEGSTSTASIEESTTTSTVAATTRPAEAEREDPSCRVFREIELLDAGFDPETADGPTVAGYLADVVELRGSLVTTMPSLTTSNAEVALANAELLAEMAELAGHDLETLGRLTDVAFEGANASRYETSLIGYSASECGVELQSLWTSLGI